MSKPRLFWDTSALIDAVFASDDSPYAELMELGEAGAVDMRISPDVTRECEGVLRRYGQGVLALLAKCFRLPTTTPFTMFQRLSWADFVLVDD